MWLFRCAIVPCFKMEMYSVVSKRQAKAKGAMSRLLPPPIPITPSTLDSLPIAIAASATEIGGSGMQPSKTAILEPERSSLSIKSTTGCNFNRVRSVTTNGRRIRKLRNSSTSIDELPRPNRIFAAVANCQTVFRFLLLFKTIYLPSPADQIRFPSIHVSSTRVDERSSIEQVRTSRSSTIKSARFPTSNEPTSFSRKSTLALLIV